MASRVLKVLPGAEPWGADGGETGVLVVHGLTSTPQSIRPLAEGLAARGYTVLAPRLPGHGTTIDDFRSSTAAEWVAEAEMSLRGLRERCSAVAVCGLSMGGTIALDLASRLGDDVNAIAVVNPSLFSTDPRARLAPLLAKLPITVKAIGNDIADPAQKELCYDRLPTRTAWEVLAFQAKVRERLEQVRAPALVFVSNQDRLVDPRNAEEVHRRISSPVKELVRLERSYHVATLDYDRDLIVERAAEFIAEHAGKP